MGLLSSIAAALSEGVGNGMVANAKWGIEEEAQRKKEAADDARLKEQMKRNDAELESRNKYYAAQLDESKTERAARAEENRLNRESNERIAGMQRRGSGGSSKRDALDSLKMLDLTIRGFDKERSELLADLENETDPGRRTAIQAQVADITQRRGALINGPAAQQIAAMNGGIGAAYLSQYFEPKGDQQQVQQAIPEALIKAPQRPKASDGGLLMRMSNNRQSTPDPAPASQAFTAPNLSDGTAQSLYQGGGTTADDARHAVSKLGYNIPSPY